MDYNFNVSFPGVDFNSYLSDLNSFPNTMRAKLEVNTDVIALTIDFGGSPNAGFKFGGWLQNLSTTGFGKSIRVSNVQQNEGILEISFEESNFLSAFDNHDNRLTIKLNTVTIHTQHLACEHEAYIRLNDAGFHFIKGFYSIFYEKENGVFQNIRMKSAPEEFDGYNCKIYPLFVYGLQQNKIETEIQITKIPQLKFKFSETETYEEAIGKINSVLSVISFFMHTTVKSPYTIIHLNNRRIITYNVLEKSPRSKSFNFRHFGINWRPEEFMAGDWKEAVFKNYGMLQKLVDLFVQASTPGVDERTKMLIGYNVIEICMGKFKIKNEEFIFKSDPKKVFNEALDVLLENVTDADKQAFTNKWSASASKLKFKPMKSPMNEFLQSKNIPLANLPIKLNDIISLRNNIIHGSLDIDLLFLKDVNILLYRMTGILILDLLGIKAKMNLSLPSRG